MNAEEIRKKAIECGHAFETMCNSKECETDEAYNTICHCEYNEVGNVAPCGVAYGYEHGFADGVEEGKRLAIKRARWIPTEYDGYADGNPVWDVYTCSACGDEHYGDSDTLTDFCPCCGARMDEEGEQKEGGEGDN